MQQAQFSAQGSAQAPLHERSGQAALRARTAKHVAGLEDLAGAQGISTSFDLVLELVTPSLSRQEKEEAAPPPPSERTAIVGHSKREAGHTEPEKKGTVKEAAPSAQRELASNARAVKGREGAIALSQLQGATQSLNPDELLSLNQLLERLVAQLKGSLSQQQFLEKAGDQTTLSKQELWALMNGWSQAKSEGENYLPSPELTQQAKALLGAANAANHGASLQLAQSLPQQQISPQAVAVQPAPLPSYVSARSLTSVTQLQLTEGQKEGLVRQIAEGFRLRGEGKQVTEIRLHPSELGVVRVKVELQGDQMRIWFAAEHASVSETISQQIEQLRAALLEQEIQLADSQFFNNHEALSEGGEGAQEEDEGAEDRGGRRRRRALQARPSPAKSLTRLRQGRFQATI